MICVWVMCYVLCVCVLCGMWYVVCVWYVLLCVVMCGVGLSLNFSVLKKKIKKFWIPL